MLENPECGNVFVNSRSESSLFKPQFHKFSPKFQYYLEHPKKTKHGIGINLWGKTPFLWVLGGFNPKFNLLRSSKLR
jgi:hypothetical protein